MWHYSGMLFNGWRDTNRKPRGVLNRCINFQIVYEQKQTKFVVKSNCLQFVHNLASFGVRHQRYPACNDSKNRLKRIKHTIFYIRIYGRCRNPLFPQRVATATLTTTSRFMARKSIRYLAGSLRLHLLSSFGDLNFPILMKSDFHEHSIIIIIVSSAKRSNWNAAHQSWRVFCCICSPLGCRVDAKWPCIQINSWKAIEDRKYCQSA